MMIIKRGALPNLWSAGLCVLLTSCAWSARPPSAVSSSAGPGHAQPASPSAPATAAATLDDTLEHGHPTAAQLDALFAAFPTLPPAERHALAERGTRASGDVLHVPDAAHERAWLATVPCDGRAAHVIAEANASRVDGLVFIVGAAKRDAAWASTFLAHALRLPVRASAAELAALRARLNTTTSDDNLVNVLFNDSLALVFFTCPGDAATRRELVFDADDATATTAADDGVFDALTGLDNRDDVQVIRADEQLGKVLGEAGVTDEVKARFHKLLGVTVPWSPRLAGWTPPTLGAIRASALAVIRETEAAPLATETGRDRARLLLWLLATTEVVTDDCPELLFGTTPTTPDDVTLPHDDILRIQVRLGGLRYQLEHPGGRPTDALAYTAGLHSVLAAYHALRAAEPQMVRWPQLDALGLAPDGTPTADTERAVAARVAQAMTVCGQ